MEEVSVPKNESISCLRICPFNDDLFLTTTWTGAVHLYSITSKTEVNSSHHSSPLLCGAWISNDAFAAGSMDGQILLSNSTVLDGHADGISSLRLLPETQILVSASWDKAIRTWDLTSYTCPCTISLNERILCADVASNYRVVAHGSGNHVFICDIRYPDQIEKRVASLGYQIRSSCIASPIEYGWAIGSIDGRIAIEYFGDVCEQAQRFSFSCNKRDEEQDVIVYPVNALAFHPVTGVLTSGSCNGDVCFWDIEAKRKLWEIPSPFGVSVSSMDYNASGSVLAIAYSYTWDKGEIEHPDDRIVVYTPVTNAITPKRKGNA